MKETIKTRIERLEHQHGEPPAIIITPANGETAPPGYRGVVFIDDIPPSEADP